MTERILTVSQLSGNLEVQLGAKSDKIRNNHLGFLNAQKMIKKFLTRDRMVIEEVKYVKFTKEELAEKLSISLLELEAFMKPVTFRENKRITGVMVLSLVKLYCSTKWAKF